MLVLLLFLKDIRSTLVIGVSIPISIVATFFLMYRTGTSLNIMSLGGLALGVGMLVDNAIVVLEAIVSRREAGADALTAARPGASEVGRAVIASTLTTVAVFLPVVFLEGIAAQLFRDQALTVSLLAAGLAGGVADPDPDARRRGRRGAGRCEPTAPPPSGRVRRTGRIVLVAVPAALLRTSRRIVSAIGRVLAVLARPVASLFDRLLVRSPAPTRGSSRAALRHRLAVSRWRSPLSPATMMLVPSLGVDLIPPLRAGRVLHRVELPEGTPLAVTDRIVAELAAGLAEEPQVESYSTIAGGAGLSLTATGSEGENSRPPPGADAPGTRAATPRTPSSTGSATGSSAAEASASSSSVRPSSPSARRSRSRSTATTSTSCTPPRPGSRRALQSVPGLVDLHSSAELGNPEVQVQLRPRAAGPPRSRPRRGRRHRPHQGPGRRGHPLHRGRPRDRHPGPRPRARQRARRRRRAT